jgi:hypothetical protein
LAKLSTILGLRPRPQAGPQTERLSSENAGPYTDLPDSRVMSESRRERTGRRYGRPTMLNYAARRTYR